MPALTQEQAAAVFGILRDRAMTLAQHGGTERNGMWSTTSSGWSLDLRGSDTRITARTRNVRATPEEAIADALELRSALLAAAGQEDGQGFVGAETIKDGRRFVSADTVHDGEVTIFAWVGTTFLGLSDDR
jgi:hypothetical protein